MKRLLLWAALPLLLLSCTEKTGSVALGTDTTGNCDMLATWAVSASVSAGKPCAYCGA